MKLVNLYNFIKSSYNNSSVDNDTLLNALKGLNLLENDELTTKDIFNVFQHLDQYNSFFSTQQITHADYNKFKDHVFFDSAVSKIDHSFYRILKFPYDKDEIKNINYKNKNDGYTKHLLENVFPKSRGSIIFDGTNIIEVVDTQGYFFNDYEGSQKKSGILNSYNNNLCVEFWYKVIDYTNDNQVIFSKYYKDLNSGIEEGYLCYISNIENDENRLNLNVIVSIRQNIYFKSFTINKNADYKHACFNLFEENGKKNIELFINGYKIEKSSSAEIGFLPSVGFSDNLSEDHVVFCIGGLSQKSLSVNGLTFNNLIGEIDEFKLSFKRKSKNEIKKEMHKNVYSNNFLKLYLKFNEPAGSHINNFICIDYSGNKIHGIIKRYNENTLEYEVLQDTSNLRNNNVNLLPMKKERLTDNPVLIGSYQSIIDQRQRLLDLAVEFDKENPNNIFKLLPRHYFIESSNSQNLPIYSRQDAYSSPESLLDEEGQIDFDNGSKLSSDFEPNSDLVNVVLIWARFFDQLKLYISSIDKILNVSYESLNKNDISSIFLPLACKHYGIEFSEIFPSITKEKISGENLVYEDIVSDLSIRRLQNLLWQRFLINSQDYLKSKGTIKSLESVFNSFGIDYSKFIDINEYSGYNDLTNNSSEKTNNLNTNIVSFTSESNIFKATPVFENTLSNSMSLNKLFLETSVIKRKLTNQKDYSGSVVDGLGNEWTLEFFINFSNALLNKNENNFNLIQNLFRLDLDNNAIISVHHQRYSTDTFYGDLFINIYPIKNNSSYVIEEKIEDVNIYDNPKYLKLSQKINENLADNDSDSIVFSLDLGDIGEVNQLNKAKTLVIQKVVANINDKVINNNISTNNNIVLRIGSYNYADLGASYLCATNDFVQENTEFQGEIIKIRAWSKFINEKESNVHLKNIENIGEENNVPYQKIIFDFDAKFQNNLENIEDLISWKISDNSLNLDEQKNYLNSCKLKTFNQDYLNIDVIKPFTALIKSQNIKYDQPTKENRVDIHSFESNDAKKAFNNYNEFPSNKPYKFYNYDSVSRTSIDMSVVKIINDDISKMIHDISEFNRQVNSFYSKYSYSYKSLEQIRKNYFDKFSDKEYVYYSDIGNIFKFFDNIMQKTLKDAIPYNSRYLGFNLVYESHALERHKYEYKNKDSNLPVVDALGLANYSRESLLVKRDTRYMANRQQVYKNGSSTLRNNS